MAKKNQPLDNASSTPNKRKAKEKAEPSRNDELQSGDTEETLDVPRFAEYEEQTASSNGFYEESKSIRFFFSDGEEAVDEYEDDEQDDFDDDFDEDFETLSDDEFNELIDGVDEPIDDEPIPEIDEFDRLNTEENITESD